MAIKQRTRVFKLRKDIKAKTTLVYLEKDGCYLMLHRDKKEHDTNQGKWLGVGGHLEAGETIYDCLKREVYEETGLTVHKYRYIGKIDFLYEGVEPERMYLFVVPEFSGEMIPCNEGTLAWIKKEDVPSLNVWEGDRLFLPLLNTNQRPIEMLLYYINDELVDVIGPSPVKERKPKCKKTKRK